MDEPQQEQLALEEPSHALAPVEPDPQSAQAEPTEADLLREQISESQRREADTNRRLDQQNARFDQMLTHRPQAVTQEPARLDANASPDPISDPDGYRNFQIQLDSQRNRDIDSRFERERAETQRANEEAQNRLAQQSAGDRLWSDFQDAYPAHKGRFQIAQSAFQSVSRGQPIDPTRTGELMAQVDAEMNRMIGTPTPAPNRTSGVQGGSFAARPSSPPKKEEEIISTLADSNFQFQEDGGYI